MTISAVLEEMQSNSPPFQPVVHSRVKRYQERQLHWNPVCVKSDALFYEFFSGEEGGAIQLLPDACLNVLFICDPDHPQALLSGAALKPRTLELKPNTSYFGFKPYSNLGMKAPRMAYTELVDQFTDLIEAFPHAGELVEKIPAAGFEDRISLFNAFAREHLIDYSYASTFVDYLTIMICAARGNLTFRGLEQETGYSERYCREKFKNGYGMSPKQYSGIMRFQGALKALFSREYTDLSALAFDSGYFDQAHFIHDFKKFTTESPYHFFKSCCQKQ